MIIITIKHCKGCRDLKEKHPNLNYIELPNEKDYHDEEQQIARNKVKELKVNAFPAFFDDDMECHIPHSMAMGLINTQIRPCIDCD